MKAQNNPIDVGAEQIKPYKGAVEDLFVSYYYQSAKHSLPELITSLDPEEKYVMNDLERNTYIALRDGLQIFKAVYQLLSDKTELKKKIVASADQLNDPVIDLVRGFCGNYATFAAAKYVEKKLNAILQAAGHGDSAEGLDLSQIQLQTNMPEDSAIKRLLAPIYANLIKHKENREVFKSEEEFPTFCRDIFAHYVRLAREREANYQQFQPHLDGYVFRLMDEFVSLQSYEDVSVSTGAVSEANKTFARINANAIVGNQLAKRKILRYIDRLALYDKTRQKNPILELGGLSWTNLFDGPPGTGKSSLFRLAMTRLDERCAQIGMPYQIVSIDQSIKDEFYGKTGKILLQKLNATQNTDVLTIVIFDDIDLLTSTRSDAQGADNDVNNIIMQYLDGVYTVRRGNVINFAASNKPTGLDGAMRNRFSDRLLIDGPVSAEDFADMVHILAKDLLQHQLIKADNGYEPFGTQKIARSDVAEYMAEKLSRSKTSTLLGFGQFMYELKQQNEFITGRSTKAIIDAVMERSADFDVPEEWFGDHALYFAKGYEEKLAALKSLYRPITAEVLFQEAQRYFDSEQRYAATESQEQISNGVNRLMWDIQAQIEFYQQQLQQHDEGAAIKLHRLKAQLEQVLRKL